jgi:hypothetical protein
VKRNASPIGMIVMTLVGGGELVPDRPEAKSQPSPWGVRERVCSGFGTGLAITESPVLFLAVAFCKGVEHALPDLVGWGVDARGRQRIHHVRAKDGVDLWESGFNFS